MQITKIEKPCRAYAKSQSCKDGRDHCFNCGRHLNPEDSRGRGRPSTHANPLGRNAMPQTPRYAVLISYPVYDDRDAVSAIEYYPLMRYGTPEGAWAGMMLWEIRNGGGDRDAHARDMLTGEAIPNPRKASLTIGSFANPELSDTIPF